METKVEKKAKRIGVFGCTADPFTLAHRAIIEEVLKSGLVDKVVVVPTTVTWHRADKVAWLTDEQRLATVRELLADLPGVEVSDAEIRLKQAAQKSKGARLYVAERHFCNQLLDLAAREEPGAELYPVFGQDSYEAMKTWLGWQQTAELSVGFIVVKRAGCGSFREQPGLPVAAVLELPEQKLAEMSATQVREKYRERGIEAWVARAKEAIAVKKQDGQSS